MSNSNFPFFDCDFVQDDEFGVVIKADGLPRTMDIEIDGEKCKATFYRERVTFEKGGSLKEMTAVQLYDFMFEESWGFSDGSNET
jgi:hypothetical protein